MPGSRLRWPPDPIRARGSAKHRKNRWILRSRHRRLLCQGMLGNASRTIQGDCCSALWFLHSGCNLQPTGRRNTMVWSCNCTFATFYVHCIEWNGIAWPRPAAWQPGKTITYSMNQNHTPKVSLVSPLDILLQVFSIFCGCQVCSLWASWFKLLIRLDFLSDIVCPWKLILRSYKMIKMYGVQESDWNRALDGP